MILINIKKVFVITVIEQWRILLYKIKEERNGNKVYIWYNKSITKDKLLTEASAEIEAKHAGNHKYPHPPNTFQGDTVKYWNYEIQETTSYNTWEAH